MKISIILGHPSINSFNHAIAETVKKFFLQNGDKIFYHDLYLEKFDPIITVEEIPKDGKVDNIIQGYCNELADSDGIIIIHPNWWGQPPALLKGWIDRVIRPGIAYKFEDNDSGEGIPIGLLKAKFAVIFNTSNTFTKREQDVFGDPLELLWNNCIFNLCGIKKFYRKMYNVICTSTYEQRKQWLNNVNEILEKVLIDI